MTSCTKTNSGTTHFHRTLDSRLLGLVLAVGLWLPSTPASAEQATIQVTPPALQFGRVATTKTRQVKLRNQGDAELVVDSIVRCAGTSEEFTASPASASVAPKKSVQIQVTYAPVDGGTDEGCLEISSNDPEKPSVLLPLAGARDEDDDSDGDSDADSDGDSDDEDSDQDSDGDSDGSEDDAMDDLRAHPGSLNFGEVGVDDSKTLTLRLRSRRGKTFDLVIDRCFGTSAEFAFSPSDILRVEPGRGTRVEVTYQPEDLGTDEGCLEIHPPLSDAEPLVVDLTAAGMEAADPENSALDLDIHDFKVRKELRLRQGQQTNVRLWVKNRGSANATAPATVIGLQGPDLVYEETMDVSDRPGNQGVSRYTFPPFTPSNPGDILWSVMIDDEDVDEDLAMAVTRVIDDQETEVAGVDLDIKRFRVSQEVSMATGQTVRLRLAVANRGTEVGSREATLIGIQGGIEIYSETLSVGDGIGDRGATNYRFPSFSPDAVGTILWSLVVVDDDPDTDEAFAVTEVVP